MGKLIAFDLDNTLAKLGEGIKEENLELLKQLENNGNTIAIISGKPTYYLSGFLRQVGLKNPILVGENGAVIQIGIDLPPEQHIIPYTDEAKRSLALIKKEIDKKLPNIFYQPNLVGVTPFPITDEEFNIIQSIIENNSENIKDIDIYRHIDSYDIVPNNISKYTGLLYLCEVLDVPVEETIAVGDGVNDYPMFEAANHSVGINVSNPEAVDINFKDINNALNYLVSKFK